MESIEEIRERAIDLVDEHIEKYQVGVAYKNSMLRHYVDTCGQRGHHLVHYNYDPTREKGRGHECWNGLYLIIRNCTFSNECDAGKDGALLGSIDLKKAENIAINITTKRIEITADYLTITIKKQW